MSKLLKKFTLKFESSSEDEILMMTILEISQNSEENTCARDSFLIKLQASATLLKKRLCHGCFRVNIEKISKNTFFYRTPPVTASVWSRDWATINLIVFFGANASFKNFNDPWYSPFDSTKSPLPACFFWNFNLPIWVE